MPKQPISGNKLRSMYYLYRREYKQAAEIVRKYTKSNIYQPELSYYQFKGMTKLAQNEGKTITKTFIKEYVNAAKYARTTASAKIIKSMFKKKFNIDISEIAIRRGNYPKEAQEGWEEIKRMYQQYKDEAPAGESASAYAKRNIAKNYIGSK